MNIKFLNFESYKLLTLKVNPKLLIDRVHKCKNLCTLEFS